ncbi:LOW QUALITY PROTEIN: topoisomerase 3-alpha [Aphomia sociella]
MKILNVAEKNDAAKNIAFHLSRGTSRRREGLSQYNKIYEFETDVFGQRAQMVMTSVSGHLLALEFIGSYKKWQLCEPLALFDAPVEKYCPENYEKIKRTLEREVRSCQKLIIWTDCDREGENIGFEIIEVCKATRNSLDVFRAKFSEITAVSVQRALQNLERPNKNVSDAVDVRQELDLRIGAAFTRFQTLRLQKVFPSTLAEKLISYGSCQFPTLGFVVERYRAIQNFVAEPFWKIKVNHTMNELSVDFSWDRHRLFDQEACQVLHDICIENPQAKVCDVKTKPKSKWRPLPLDTVELEKLASRKLKINAKETMRLAEKLYTQGFISYPRTETNEFPKEMNLGQLVGQQTSDPNWAFAQGMLDSGGPTPRQGNKSDKAHPPIHPTKYTNSLSGNEQRLYEFIVRSFLACCSKDAQGQETTVVIDVANEKFTASGLMIIARNYLDVYPYDKWSAREIHQYQMDQTFTPTAIDLIDGSTSPPNLLTEADLIGLMEKHGIGTDATHAEHIETIKSRSYVALADAIHFVPGVLGMGLVDGYDAMGLEISKPHLRAQLEADLKAISEGSKQPHQVLAEQVAKYKEVYRIVTAKANELDNALAERFDEQPSQYTSPTINTNVMPAVLKCPKCGNDMILRQKKNNPEEFYIGCMSYPNCKNSLWLPSIVKTLQVLDETCPSCGPSYKKIKFEWRNNSISHIYPPPYIACIGGCDTTFLELLQINLSSVRRVTQNNTIRTNNNRPNNNLRETTPSSVNGIRTALNGSNTTMHSRSYDLPVATNNQYTNNSVVLRSSTVSDDNNVMCRCNKAAIIMTVRKQNHNFGKKFYKCPVGKDSGGCDFFLWAPESVEERHPFVTPPSNDSWGQESTVSISTATIMRWGPTPSISGNSFSENNEEIICHCNLPSKKVKVNKEGPNKDRSFYGCSKDFNNRCNFFQWADGGHSNSNYADSGGSSSSTRGRGGFGTGRGRRGTGRGGGMHHVLGNVDSANKKDIPELTARPLAETDTLEHISI